MINGNSVRIKIKFEIALVIMHVHVKGSSYIDR